MSSEKHLGRGSSFPTLPDDGKLVLLSMRFCPYAQRVHLVLDAKGIPYHTIYVNLTNKPEWLTQKSPLGKVPALELANEPGRPTIYESLVVCEYLDEKYKTRPLLPKDPLQKARDRILIERFNQVISSMYKVFLQGLDSGPGSLTDIVQGLDLYEKELKNRDTPFFAGKEPGMLDYMIWPWCERADMLEYLVGNKYEMDQDRFPKLIKWRSQMKSDPAVQKTYLSGETHAKYIQGRRIGAPDYDMLV
uniref:Putative glutathione s-transferase omega-1-like protein n=1 Tax=Tabanus bromius TaxID=304241 RepID=A0A0K8TTU5_TABBR